MKRKFPVISFVATIVTMTIGILVLTGWFIHNDFLRSIVPGAVKMKFNVALGFVFSSIVLLLNYSPRENKRLHFVSIFLSVLVSLIGLLTLIEYISGINIGIDELFIRDELRTTAIYYAGRMSPLAALNFVLIGTGLLLLNEEKTAAYQFYYLSGIAFIALLMLIGFNFISDIPTYIRLAIHVAFGFITLPVAIWFAQPMLQKKISFERKLFTGFTAVIIIMVVLGIFSSYYSDKRISTAKLVEHTNNVLNESEQTLSLVKDIESGERGYIITADSNYLDYFIIAKNSISSHINKLNELINDGTFQQLKLDSLSALVDKRIAFSLQCIKLRNEKAPGAANSLMATGLGKLYTDKIRYVVSEIQQEENNLHAREQKESNKSITSFNRAFFVFLASVFILLIIILFAIFDNINIRKKTAAELKKSERNFQLLVSSVKDYAIFLLDKNGYVASWNSGAEGIKGYSAEEIIGKPIDIFYTAEEIQQGVPKTNLQLTLQKGHFETEGLRIRKDGSTFYANIVFTSLVDENGQFYGYSKVTKDITEKKKAEERLLFLASIADNIQDPVISNDNNFIITRWNKPAEKLLEWKSEEVLGKNALEIFKTNFPYETREQIFEVVKAKGFWQGELIYHTKSGRPVHVLSTFSYLKDADGNITGNLVLIRDITKRKQAEEKLEEFEHFFNNSHDLCGIANTVGYFDIINANFSKVLGYSEKEFCETPFIELIHPDDVAVTLHEYEKLKSGELTINFINRYRKKDGSYLYLDWNTTPNPLTGKLYCVARDITDRKKTEDALSKLNEELEQRVIERTEEVVKSERRFRALIENNYDIISLIDESFKIIYRSPSVTRVMGFDTGEMKKMEGIENVHPEDREYAANLIREAMANPGKPLSAIFRRQHKNGHYVWLEGKVTNLLHDVQVKAIVTNFRDVTERIESDEKLIKSEKIYKTIASSIPGSVICLLDPDYRYLLVEGDMLEKLGYSKDRLLGNKAEDVLTPEVFISIQNEFKKVLEGETITTESSTSGYDIISRFIPLKDENNIVYAIMTVAIDVTELKNAQRDIIEINRGLEEKIINRTGELRKANEELEAFSYSVSHDLRAPLRGIIGFTAILEEEYGSKLDDEAKRITSVIKSNTIKMGDLIDDLLNFSRMGRHEITKTTIDPNQMVNDIINDLDKRNSNRVIDWLVHTLPGINGDISMIRQVWVNLISNAIKYSRNTSQPHIEIGSFIHEGQTAFFVKDNGVGFDEKYSDKLFKVFQRLHSVHEFEGTGVGLAIVEKIISKHGGKVWVKAEINKGATFYFSLPAT